MLEFRADAIPYFEIVTNGEPSVIARLEELGIQRKSISAHVVEDVLFGPMEDLGVLESLGLVSLEEVYEAFVTYVTICVESRPLKQFLDWCRDDPEDSDVYDHLLQLYRKLVAEGPRIQKRKDWRNKIRRFSKLPITSFLEAITSKTK